MWDEEGLEHLGGLTTTPGSNTTHHIGSFDSDLNSIVSSEHSCGHRWTSAQLLRAKSFCAPGCQFRELHIKTFKRLIAQFVIVIEQIKTSPLK